MTAAAEALFDLSGRVFLIAGAASGIARALVATLVVQGARPVLTDVDPAKVDRIAAIYEDALSFQTDITDADAVECAVQRTRDRYGRIDGGINAAGLLPISPSETMDPATFRRCVDVNLTGAFLFSRALSPVLKAEGGGRLLHISSVSSMVSNPSYAAYAGSKGGLAQIVRVLAREWAPDRITVNAIGPALTRTSLTEDYLADPEFHARAVNDIPMGRLGEPEDIVGAALLLLGPGGAFITGQTIYVDGGRTLV